MKTIPDAVFTVSEAKAYIEDDSRNVIRPGLARVEELLLRLGEPQKKLCYIHAAGTNGKGSVCAMLEAVLSSAGYRTGLYTSPHLVRVNEEICVDGEEISDAALASLTARVSQQADAMTDPPSRFEIMTAAALLYFQESGCEIAVLETGMGGTSDATNIIPPPEVSIITNIGLDHTAFLGDTVEEIAAQKAGIIKPGSRVVCYDLPENVRRVIDSVCRQRGVPVRYAAEPVRCGARSILYKGCRYELALAGSYQLRNTAVVLEAIDVLREGGWEIPQEAVFRGLKNVSWPARFEILQHAPLVVLDGGHNAQCAQAFAESLPELLQGKLCRLVLGMLRDKEYDTVISVLGPLSERIYCVAPENERALPARALAEEAMRQGFAAFSYCTPEEGVRAALDDASEEEVIAVFGSLYLAGPVRKLFI